MTLIEMVRDNKKVKFLFYRDGSLWYATEEDFRFPVPVSDIGNAIFNAEEKALIMMRWIKPQMALVNKVKPGFVRIYEDHTYRNYQDLPDSHFEDDGSVEFELMKILKEEIQKEFDKGILEKIKGP